MSDKLPPLNPLTPDDSIPIHPAPHAAPAELLSLVRYAVTARLAERIHRHDILVLTEISPILDELKITCNLCLSDSTPPCGLNIDLKSIPDDAVGIWGLVEYAALLIAQQINAGQKAGK